MEKIVLFTIGGIVISLLITFLGLWFCLGKMGDIAKELSTSQVAMQPALDSFQRIATHLDTLCGGSGIKPV